MRSKRDSNPVDKPVQPISLDETSPSIQTHLGIIQNIIQRMASNSTACKTWCISLVSAILVFVADKSKPDFVWIALFPSLLFLALDAYYLALEKGFRNRYNDFVLKVHNKSLTTSDLFSVSPIGNPSALQIEALKSFAVWGLYIPLIVLIILARFFIIAPPA